MTTYESADKAQTSEIPPSPATLEPSGPRRARLSRAERGSVLVAEAGVAGFTGYGFVTHSPSTVGYVSSVLVIAAAVIGLRRAALPGLLAAGLAISAIVTLAGGLIRVGHDVLYNANTGPYSPALGTHYLQYDHFAHAYVSFVVVFACWFMLAAPYAGRVGRRDLVLLAVGAALGLGGLNEMVEFIATLAHHGAHAGGYWNTGWDLVSNFIGATAAGLSRLRLGAVAASAAMFTCAVVVLGALTPRYDQWSDTVSRLGSPGERGVRAVRTGRAEPGHGLDLCARHPGATAARPPARARWRT